MIQVAGEPDAEGPGPGCRRQGGRGGETLGDCLSGEIQIIEEEFGVKDKSLGNKASKKKKKSR